MTTTPDTKRGLEQRLAQLEQRLARLSEELRAWERHTAELDGLREEVGKLKFELEDMREE